MAAVQDPPRLRVQAWLEMIPKGQTEPPPWPSSLRTGNKEKYINISILI